MNEVIHNIHDKFFKQSLSDIRVARDFFRTYLPRAISVRADMNTLQLYNNSFVDKNWRAYEADVIYQVNFGKKPGFFYILTEQQTKPDASLTLRIVHYIILLLMDYRKKHPSKSLPLVYPFIVYTGEEPYQFSTRFFDLFEDEKMLMEGILSEPFQLIDVMHMSEEEVEKSPWFCIVEMAYRSRRARIIEEYLSRLMLRVNKIKLQQGDNFARIVMEYVVSAEERIEVDTFVALAEANLSDQLKGETMTIAEQFRQQGRELGLEQGQHKTQ